MNLIQITNGTPTTTSLQIAEYFKKDHSKVLKQIRNLIENTEANFGLSEYKDDSGKNNICYIMDKASFSLLAMGFTGKKAMKFKWGYIQAFEAMEKQLVKPQFKQLSLEESLELNLKLVKQNKDLAKQNTELALRDLEVKTEKDYKWKTKQQKNDMGNSINYYVFEKYLPLISLDLKEQKRRAEAHNAAKAAFRKATGINIPHYINKASKELKATYLGWLSKVK